MPYFRWVSVKRLLAVCMVFGSYGCIFIKKDPQLLHMGMCVNGLFFNIQLLLIIIKP